MAEIYLARSLGIEGFEKHVVLKKILPEHSRNPAFVRMFLDEARLAAKLQHQNIAQVYDIGRISDGYFFVMEYLHGRDLRSIKREHRKRATRLPIHHGLTIAANAAAGLDYAHNAKSKRGEPLGLVHRDVSPSNVVVTFDGAVKLVDFGIALANNTKADTGSGALKGKVPYMSPEQCRGHDLDGRSDLFSLGATLYELTTGISPFCDKGDTDYTVLEKICKGQFNPPREELSSFPEGFERIILKALAHDRTKRYQSAREMLRDIETVAANLGVPLSATALADHLESIYGEQRVPWSEDYAEEEEDVEDELLLQTIATGSVVEGVTLYQITPSADGSAVLAAPTTSGPSKRPILWLGFAVVVAAAGVALAISTLGGESSEQPPPEPSARPADLAPAAASAPRQQTVSAPPETNATDETEDVASEPATRKRSKRSQRKRRPRVKEVAAPSTAARVPTPVEKPTVKAPAKTKEPVGPTLDRKPLIKSKPKPKKDPKKGLIDREW